MELRRLRGTDLDVSVLCYGPMRSAKDRDDGSWRGNERGLRAAIDHGVNFIHSSYEYGVRWMMRDVLKDHPKRKDLHHVIKVPVPDWEDEGFDPRKFELRIDEALRDLCTDRIALIQWMWRVRPDDEAHRLPLFRSVIDDVKATFERLRDGGKVGHLGCFPYYRESARAAVSEPAISVLIAYYNLLELEMSSLLDDMVEANRGFLAIRPLFQGVFGDRWATQSEIPDGHRLKAESFAPAYAARARLVQAFPEIAEMGMTRFALRFPLLSPACGSIIVGMNSEQQVEDVCAHLSDVRPDPERLRTVRQPLAVP